MTKPQPTRAEILEAMKTPPPGGAYVWDGDDEDDRPATEEELKAGMEAVAALALAQKLKAFDPLVNGGEVGRSNPVGTESDG